MPSLFAAMTLLQVRCGGDLIGAVAPLADQDHALVQELSIHLAAAFFLAQS